jgi:hypothetical protein
MLEFSYKGVKLSYKKGLFSNVTGQIAPLEENDPNTPGWPGSVPEHYQIDFEGYPLQDTFHKPQILLYPVKAYAAANPAAGDIAKALDDALRVDKLPGKLPFLPMWNAAQVYVASPQILAFQSGRGARYLSCYAQAIVPVGNGCIFYTYQGLTADGNYYLSVVMPIRLDTLDLPEYKDKFDYATMDGPKYEAYLKEMLNVITAAKPEEFSPSMSELDALVKSVLVTPEVVLKGVEGTTAVNCPGALASRLRSNMHIRVTFTDGTPLRLRDGAGKTATVLLTIPEGGKMMVVDGPQCVNAGVWWKVKLDSGGQTGWVLEGEDNVYFIEPVP